MGSHCVHSHVIVPHIVMLYMIDPPVAQAHHEDVSLPEIVQSLNYMYDLRYDTLDHTWLSAHDLIEYPIDRSPR